MRDTSKAEPRRALAAAAVITEFIFAVVNIQVFAGVARGSKAAL